MSVIGALEAIKQEENDNIIQLQKPPEKKEKLTTFKDWKKKVTEFLKKYQNERLISLLDQGIAEEIAKKEIDKPLNHTVVASIMLELFDFCRIDSEEGVSPVYIYDPDKGIYINDLEFLKDIINVIEYRHNERRANDCIYSLRRQTPRKQLEENPNYIIVGNGIYNRKTKQLEPFTPSKIYTSKIKTNYNPNAQKVNIKGWDFESWLLDLFSGDQGLYQLALQLLNACIRGESLGKMFWFIGEGGTGKGTLQELFINLVGRENIASIKITDLDANNRFTLAQALGKRAVIGDDIQQKALIKDTSKLFSLVGGDTVSIEKKGKDAYSTFIKTVVIQSTNEMPRLDGDKNAIMRRMVILPFQKVFSDGTKKPNRLIKHDYIKRKEVLEYVLKLVINLEFDEFVQPKVSREILKEYQQSLDTIQQFADELFQDIQSTFLPNDFVWWRFTGFVGFHNHQSSYTSQGLNSKFDKYLPSDWRKTKYPITIPKGQELPKGFKPNEDTPPYQNKTFGYYRFTPTKTVRGYEKTTTEHTHEIH